MVTTRPKTSAVVYQEFSDNEDEDHSKVQDTYDSDDEKPRKKKAKKNKASAKSHKDHKALLMKTFFEVLPLDIIFEIFSHLHPINLLNLAHTNKLLRSFLMRKSSSFVWKRARRSIVPPIPECPEDQSEPQWAHLIFNRDCAICGKPKTQKIIWNLRMRGCGDCFARNLLDRKDVLQRFGDIEELSTVLAVLPYSQTKKHRYLSTYFYNSQSAMTTSAASHRSRAKRLYLASSIEAMAPIIEDFLLRIDAGVPNAKKDYGDWVDNKKAEVERIMINGAMLDRQGVYAASASSVLEDQKKEARHAAIIERLLALGHNHEDVVAIPSLTGFCSTEVTETLWQKIKTRCEGEVAGARRIRIYRDRMDIIAARKEVLKKLYNEHRTALGLGKFAMFPPFEDVLEIPVFRDAIENEDHDQVTEDAFTAAMKTLPAFAVKWIREKKSILLRWFGATPSDDHVLPLATSVLLCQSCGHLVSLDETLGEHLCDGGTLAEMGWALDNLRSTSHRQRAAVEVVSAVGLDPATATASEMDKLSARFSCGCSPQLARNWKNCIIHAEQKHSGAPTSDWTVLSKEVTERVRELETTIDDTARLICNRCFNDEVRTFDHMRDHIANYHISNIVSSDYCVDMTDRAAEAGSSNNPVSTIAISSGESL